MAAAAMLKNSLVVSLMLSKAGESLARLTAGIVTVGSLTAQ